MVRLLWGLALVLLALAPVNAQSIRLEAESLVAYHDEGGTAIYITSCSGASGGKVVEGFDWPGDWIEVLLTVPDNGTFADTLRSGGLTGFESQLRSTVFGAGPLGEDLLSTFNTLGYGIG